MHTHTLVFKPRTVVLTLGRNPFHFEWSKPSGTCHKKGYIWSQSINTTAHWAILNVLHRRRTRRLAKLASQDEGNLWGERMFSPHPYHFRNPVQIQFLLLLSLLSLLSFVVFFRLSDNPWQLSNWLTDIFCLSPMNMAPIVSSSDCFSRAEGTHVSGINIRRHGEDQHEWWTYWETLPISVLCTHPTGTTPRCVWTIWFVEISKRINNRFKRSPKDYLFVCPAVTGYSHRS